MSKLIKSGLFWSVLLVILAFPASTIGNGYLSPILFFAALITILATLIQRLRRRKKKTAPVSAPPTKTPVNRQEEMRVAGTSYRRDNIESIAERNDDYTLPKKDLIEGFEDKIYEYDGMEIAHLVPEPTNEYDPDAIRIECEGVLIGYVPKGKTGYIRDLQNKGLLIKSMAHVYGGKLKLVNDDTVEKSESPFYADLILTIRSEAQ